MRRTAILGAGVLATTIAFAASVEVGVGSKKYYVDTGTDAGVCRTRDVANGHKDTVCRDGQNMAALSSEAGCLDSAGKGYCALGRRRLAAEAGSELTCGSGESYFLLVGSDATCQVKQTEKSCQSSDGKSTAVADCTLGCVRTTGAGNCCGAGTSGCPPTIERAP
jgi:hypothetical protein